MKLMATCIAALAVSTITAPAADPRITGPYSHDNLSIYLVHGPDQVEKKYLTLAEAMKQRKVVVYETSDVNQLQVENLSGQDVYIQSGEIVKGGKQDRVLESDLILPTSSGKVDISAFCVEQGRWSKRGAEKVDAFSTAEAAIASPKMKRAVKEKASQSAVWAEVSAVQDRLAKNLGASVKSAASESSYQLTLETQKVQQIADGFKKELSGLADKFPDTLGYVAAVNGKVTGADVYANHDLFRKLWPKLLGSAAVEAMASAKPDKDSPPPPMADVRAAATGKGARVSNKKQINRRTTSLKSELPHGLVFETKDADAPATPVHRSYVSK